VQLHASRHRTGAIGVGVLGIALALPVMTATAAHADKGKERCAEASVEYSLDGGKTWSNQGRMDDKLVTRIQVKLKERPRNNCEYAVSLASYSAEGPTWPTTGKQSFLGWDTAKLSRGKQQATLDVSGSRPPCFGQVDLYGNGKKYDGVANPLPQYPKSGFDGSLITAWNGGEKCTTPTTPPSTAPPTTKPPTTSAPSTSAPSTTGPTGTKPPGESTKPSGSTKPPTDSTKPSSTSSKPVESSKPEATTSAPAVAVGDSTTPPVGKPEVKPVTDIAPASLAETGADNSPSVLIGASAAAFIVLGAGTFAWTRRRSSGGGTTA
jgi:hypothetical protein